jgi:hypothetical protein
MDINRGPQGLSDKEDDKSVKMIVAAPQTLTVTSGHYILYRGCPAYFGRY